MLFHNYTFIYIYKVIFHSRHSLINLYNISIIFSIIGIIQTRLCLRGRFSPYKYFPSGPSDLSLLWCPALLSPAVSSCSSCSPPAWLTTTAAAGSAGEHWRSTGGLPDCSPPPPPWPTSPSPRPPGGPTRSTSWAAGASWCSLGGAGTAGLRRSTVPASTGSRAGCTWGQSSRKRTATTYTDTRTTSDTLMRSNSSLL